MRGGTPTHTFTLPFDTAYLKEIKIVYKQGECIVLEKRLEDCTLEGNDVSLTLTQEETFLFDEDKTVCIQVRAMNADGTVIPSCVIRISPGVCLDSEVLE